MRYTNYFITLLLCCFLTPLNAQLQLFSSPDNQYQQQFYRTADDGFLIAATQYCYTPGQIVIEGCPRGVKLYRFNSEADTLWSNTVYLGYESIRGFFANADGTYSLFISSSTNFSCGFISIGGPIGFSKIKILRLDASGNIIAQTTFPDECSLSLHSVRRLGDDRFLVIARYSEPNFQVPPAPPSPFSEQIFIMDGDGEVEQMTASNDEKYISASLRLTGGGAFNILYRTDSTFKLRQFDADLNLLDERESPDLSNSCFFAPGPETVSTIWREDGSFSQLCHRRNEEVDNTFFVNFGADLVMSVQDTMTMNDPSRMVVGPDDLIYCVDPRPDNPDISFSVIKFSSQGDSLDSEPFQFSENLYADDLLFNAADQNFWIAGSYNCCNQPESIGPGQTFFYELDGTISPTFEQSSQLSTTLKLSPNPFSDDLLLQIEEKGSQLARADYVLELYSIDGRFLLRKAVSSRETLDLRRLESGVFLARLWSEGELLLTQRIVKM